MYGFSASSSCHAADPGATSIRAKVSISSLRIADCVFVKDEADLWTGRSLY